LLPKLIPDTTTSGLCFKYTPMAIYTLGNSEDIWPEKALENSAQRRPSRNPIDATFTKNDYRSTLASQESTGAVTNAKPLMHTNPAPPYPRIARQRGWQGTVRLNVLVEKDGTPDQVGIQLSSGHHVLDNAALQAVRQWKFSPAQSGQLRFSSKIIIPIQFTLIREQ